MIRPWSGVASGRRRTAIGAAIVAVIALEALASVRIGFPSFETRIALLTLLTGLAVAVCGLAAWLRAPSSRIGPLLLATAAAWYIGGFRWVAYDPLAALAEVLALVYAAIVAHAVLTFPSGRASGWLIRAIVVAGYLAAVAPVPRAEVIVALTLLVGVGVAVISPTQVSRVRRLPFAAGLLFALVLGGAQLAYEAIDAIARLDIRPILHASLVLAAASMAWPILRAASRAGRVSDVVIELGSRPRHDLVSELGALVGDPDLELGFWIPADERYLDAFGTPVAAPSPETGRMATPIESEGTPLALVVLDVAVTVDEGVRAAIGRALTLAAANAQLQGEVRARIADVRASRRRLMLAGDEERLALDERLSTGLAPYFDRLDAMLASPALEGEVVVESALRQLEEARAELVQLVNGLGPPVLGERGIAAALAELAARAPVPVQLHIETEVLPARAAQTALFVTSEALANLAKHARSTHASVRLTRDDGHVSVEVTDDGQGGADPARGSGLRGLIDRVEAMGGRLVIESGDGRGTRVAAHLPLEEPGW